MIQPPAFLLQPQVALKIARPREEAESRCGCASLRASQ